jgi:hypothetical protein
MTDFKRDIRPIIRHQIAFNRQHRLKPQVAEREIGGDILRIPDLTPPGAADTRTDN